VYYWFIISQHLHNCCFFVFLFAYSCTSMANWCNVHCFPSATCSYTIPADCYFGFCHLLVMLIFAACTPLASKCTVHFFFLPCRKLHAQLNSNWFMLIPVALQFLLFILTLAPQVFFLSLAWLPHTDWLWSCFCFSITLFFYCLCICYFVFCHFYGPPQLVQG